MLLGDLIRGLPIVCPACPEGADGVRVCDLTEDSRTAVPGSLFVARGGLKADGKRFMADAAAAGAVAILSDQPGLTAPDGFDLPMLHAPDIALASALIGERFYGSPASRLGVFGVTGTNGKTTISFLVWKLLNAARHRCGLIGTVMVDDGVECGPASMTTPPAMELSRTMATMVESGCGFASMEVSSHALHQKRADALEFRVAAFTNLTGDHLDYHGTMEAYAAAKARLFERLPASGVAVVNASDPWTPRMVRDCAARVVRCAVMGEAGDDGADATVRIIDETLSGMTLQMRLPIGEVVARVPLLGRYNAMNVLQAFVSAHALLTLPTPANTPGLSASEALAVLAPHVSALVAPPGRLERVSTDEDAFSVFVDYAHSDDSLRNLLRSVGRVMPGRGHGAARVTEAAGSTHEAAPAPGRLWVVFGCGGDRDTSKRPRMGLAAVELADRVVVTSDNPRSERPGDIIDQILSGLTREQRHQIAVHPDRARAIRMAIEEARPGDVIVIAGKGHETEQILSNGAGGLDRTHFDDREIARAILAERRVSSGSSVTKGGSIESKPSRRVAPGRSAGVPRSSPARGRGSGEGTEGGDSGL
jgi:UDP-N-acetylmuramoyl-L-alanyl-D-glutamate--2,6-diaminopimelate ligase